MSGPLVTESDVIRTLDDGTYTLPELYELVAAAANIARDRGLEPPDEQHPTDRVWRRRVRGTLQALRASGNANRIATSVWAIRGTSSQPQHLVLIARDGQLAHLELLVRGAALLLSTLDEPADLVLCDPPYGLERGTARSSANRNYRRDHTQVVPGYVDVPDEAYTDFTCEWVSAAAGALRPGGTLAVITGPQKAAIVQYLAEQAGLNWLNSIAAFKQFALRTTRRFACSHWTVTLMCRGRPESPRRVFNTPADLPKARSHADYPLDWWPDNGRADRPGLVRYDNSLPGRLGRPHHRSVQQQGRTGGRSVCRVGHDCDRGAATRTQVHRLRHQPARDRALGRAATRRARMASRGTTDAVRPPRRITPHQNERNLTMAHDSNQTDTGNGKPPQRETIHDLFARIREHPDFVFGAVFALDDFADGTVPGEFSPKQAEERISETGNRLIADAGGCPQDE